jgi:hypothetical protein
MATLGDVRRIAGSLPGTSIDDGQQLALSVTNAKGKSKGYAWVWLERVAPKQPRIPRPDVLAVRVPSVDDKEALIAADPDTFFTEPHYNGFPAVLVRLAVIGVDELAELLQDAWRIQSGRHSFQG